jgi:pseudouridine-5'-phosphate glycosidase
VRAHGATPATIAVLAGIPHIVSSVEQGTMHACAAPPLFHFSRRTHAHRHEQPCRSSTVPAHTTTKPMPLHQGLTEDELKQIARGGAAVRKTSRQNLPAVMAMRLHGATTVSATMLLAARAGIEVGRGACQTSCARNRAIGISFRVNAWKFFNFGGGRVLNIPGKANGDSTHMHTRMYPHRRTPPCPSGLCHGGHRRGAPWRRVFPRYFI